MKYDTENQYNQHSGLSSSSLICPLVVSGLPMSSLKSVFISVTLLLLFLFLFSLAVSFDSFLQFLFAEIPHMFMYALHFFL